MKGFKRFFKERWWTDHSRHEDPRPYFEAVHFFQAADQEEAEGLFERMVEALGCGEGSCGEDKECPHFRFGSLKVMDDA